MISSKWHNSYSKRCFSKKGIFDVTRKIYFYMVMGVVITVSFLAFAIMLVGYNNSLTTIPSTLEAELIAERFINNPDCFVYQVSGNAVSLSTTTQYIPNSLDLSKFNEYQLSRCYTTDPETGYEGINFELVLPEEGKRISTNNFFQREDFVIIKPISLWDGSSLRESTLVLRVQGEV